MGKNGKGKAEAKAEAKAAKAAEGIREKVKALFAGAFFFERSDGSLAVVVKSSPRRKGFTVNLTDLTADEAREVGQSVAEFLLVFTTPEGVEYARGRAKKFEGYKK